MSEATTEYTIKFTGDNDVDTKNIRDVINKLGFVVVTNVLSPSQISKGKQLFLDWYNNNPQVSSLHIKVSTRGIFKHFAVGGTDFVWYSRTRKAVSAVFRAVHGLQPRAKLITSLDGACYIPASWNKKRDLWPSKSWVHTDQKPKMEGKRCVQGYLSYTDNPSSGRTTIFYRGSHHLFQSYYAEFAKAKKENKQWTRIDINYLKRPEIAKLRTTVSVPAGSMVLWDSRVFHSTQYGTNVHERLVSYICMLPKTMDTPQMAKKRKLYAMLGRTTSHWPVPIGVNAKHTQTYGDDSLLIRYDSLPHIGVQISKKAYYLRIWSFLAGCGKPSFAGSKKKITLRGKSGLNTDDVFILGMRLGRQCFFHGKSTGLQKKARKLL